MAKILGDAFGTIGEMKFSMLTLTQFQALYGTGWVLADGSSYPSSKYAAVKGTSTVPNFLGLHLRAANANDGAGSGQNPDNTLLGGTQSDQNLSHSHGGSTVSAFGAHRGSGGTVGGGGFGLDFIASDNNNNTTNGHVHGINADGGNEARPRSGTGNLFIRIN